MYTSFVIVFDFATHPELILPFHNTVTPLFYFMMLVHRFHVLSIPAHYTSY